MENVCSVTEMAELAIYIVKLITPNQAHFLLLEEQIRLHFSNKVKVLIDITVTARYLTIDV